MEIWPFERHITIIYHGEHNVKKPKMVIRSQYYKVVYCLCVQKKIII